MTLPIKRLHHLPPHLSYVSTLLDITKKPKTYVVFVSMALKRAGCVSILQ